MAHDIREAFHLQAGWCRLAGSELTARVLEALAEVLDGSSRTGARILDWPGDPVIDAMKLRIAGGINAIARSGDDPELTKLYASGTGDFEAVLARVLRAYDGRLYPWLDRPPQTNEVGRAAALWPGIMTIASRFGPDVELIEIGPSAGLNLNMDRFNYELGGVKAGDAQSAVRLCPDWQGPPPVAARVNVTSRIGVDPNPLDVTIPEIAERLMAYVWPDQPERVARTAAAIAIAQAHPPRIEAGDATTWIAERLALPQAEGVTRIVYHSIVLQYLPISGRKQVVADIAAAGARASRGQPLAWLNMEHHARGAPAELRLACWPGGKAETLAHLHPHGAMVNWLGGA